MRVSQVSNISYSSPNRTSFGAFITKRFMDGALIWDDKLRSLSTSSQQDRSKLFSLTSLLFQKAKEITSWDNFHTTIDIVPKASENKAERLYDIVVSSSKDAKGKPYDGIGYSVVVKTFDAAQKGVADAFINLSKKAYLRAKRPVIVQEAQRVFKENSDVKVLDSIQKRLGNDTFEVFKHEYFRLKNVRNIFHQEEIYQKCKELK